MKISRPVFFPFLLDGYLQSYVPFFQFQHIFVRRMSEKVYELGF